MELNVSDKEFYDLMMKSLKEEVKNVTKKNLELKEGLKYKKLLFCKWVVIIRLFTMFRAHCIPISHFFWR